MSDAGQLVSDVAGTLVDAYGLQPVEVTPIPVDTKRVYYLVTDCSGRQWFVKVYRDRTVFRHARARGGGRNRRGTGRGGE